MIVKINENLSKYTSVKIGGIAENFYIPESKDELYELCKKLSNEKYYLLGGGSNLLINDTRKFKHVICLRQFSNDVINLGNGKFYFGASIPIQKVINYVNKLGYGGIEYLYSLPARLGGIIYMNAGRGRVIGKSVSDYVVNVDVYCNGISKTIDKNECLFGYRKSVFQTMPNSVITGVTLQFDIVDKKESERRIKERMEYCKKKQDYTGGTFGSVFNQYNPKIMRIVMKYSSYRNDGIHFSSKTINWMVNKNGTYKQAIRAIRIVSLIHRITFQKCSKEVIIWK